MKIGISGSQCSFIIYFKATISPKSLAIRKQLNKLPQIYDSDKLKCLTKKRLETYGLMKNIFIAVPTQSVPPSQ